MTQIRLDKVIIASFIDTFLNYQTATSLLSISGSIPDGGSSTFSAILTIDRTNTLAEVFAENQNTGKKMSMLAGSVHNPYQSVSSEVRGHGISLSGNTLTVSLTIDNNSGAGINLTAQVWDITAVLQRVPF